MSRPQAPAFARFQADSTWQFAYGLPPTSRRMSQMFTPRPSSLPMLVKSIVPRAARDRQTIVCCRAICAARQSLFTLSTDSARGTPRVPDGLVDHDCIASEATHSRDWNFRKAGADYAVAISHRLMVTTVETAIDAALAHVGIANLMSYHAAEYVANEQLRIVLEQFEPSLRPLRARVRVNAVQVAVCVP
ncbi:MAG TPA: LysR substrate-binding domain-containing protein [Steroidobacteraceae bacterium]|nr:LysR substrate-binding domain-containing protein [Steroidobacteraceae bacterium]